MAKPNIKSSKYETPMQKSHFQFFGRQVRALTDKQKGLIQTVLPEYSICDEKPLANISKSLANHKKAILEIGFGDGRNIVNLARQHPNNLYMGCEPYLNGVAKVLSAIEEHNITNLRVIEIPFQNYSSNIPDSSLDQVYVLFPDPWPKKRHHKRRLIQNSFLLECHRMLKPKGELIIATDHSEYCAWIMYRLINSPLFKWIAKDVSDWDVRPKHLIETRYENKALAGKPAYLRFIRCAT